MRVGVDDEPALANRVACGVDGEGGVGRLVGTDTNQDHNALALLSLRQGREYRGHPDLKSPCHLHRFLTTNDGTVVEAACPDREENTGALIHNLGRAPREANEQENTRSVHSKLHTGNTSSENPPDFFGLVCLLAGHNYSAASITSSIHKALSTLPHEQVDVLPKLRVCTWPAPSFAGPDANGSASHRPILPGPSCFPRSPWTSTTPPHATKPPKATLDNLYAVLQKVRREFVLRPGDFVIADNTTKAHRRRRGWKRLSVYRRSAAPW
ncbi:TauD/TfdA family dioxygenase [Streptomyces sp. NPDC050523]|uniref:TauD/TfdA family dioxygenase n=1 Tax=Streptomyces sp. NPDC050523 TaxID=3365622 RepID=UPI0037A4B415